jgi:uncharacterized delta-60 repeat protein
LIIKINKHKEHTVKPSPWVVRFGFGVGLFAFVAGCGTDFVPPYIEVPDEIAQNGNGTDAGTPPVDADYAVARFNSDGTLDTSFGNQGSVVVDVGGVSGTVRDSVWGGTVDSSGRILVFGSRKADANRFDADRIVLRLTADGARDTAFGTEGVFSSGVTGLNDNARHGFVQGDGKIVTSGYTSMPTGVGTQSANRLVLTRINDNGTADNSFAYQGVLTSVPTPLVPATPLVTAWGMAEAYGVAVQSSGSYVTAGYGRRTSGSTDQVDMLSCRYTSTGALDTTYGGGDGTVELNVAGGNDRGQNLLVLPDDRIVVVGSGSPTTTNVDAMVTVLTEDGAMDAALSADGYKLYDFGRTDESYLGVAFDAANDRLVAAGHRAAIGTSGPDADDDGILFIWTLSGTPVTLPAPLSETEHDRLISATFDAAGKILSTGYIGSATDRRMAVARFNIDGSLDTSFGQGGIASVNLSPNGIVETGRGISVLSDGKIIVIGAVDHH